LEKYIHDLITELSKKLSYLDEIDIILEIPVQAAHGDLSLNAAMSLARKLKRKPREIAEEIIAGLEYDPEVIEKVEIAGPGFINFFFRNTYLPRIIKEILDKKENFGKTDAHRGKRANVEFVSANPTGPLTVGHGRNAVLGDTVANLLECTGYKVEREYYFNNAGRQMRVLGDSVKQRYLQMTGEDIEFPEDYYQGEYITETAGKLYEEYGDRLKEEDPEGKFKQTAEDVIFEQIKSSLLKLGVKHDIFYNEKTLYEEKKIDEVIERLRERNFIYEKNGAVWLKLTELGIETDKVIVKSTGEPTYRLPDIAYHIEKYKRGYDLMIDIFGSDHIDTYPDVLAGIKALGYDETRVVVLIHQFVTVVENGEVVKMSTRKANYITLDELVDEAGSDVVRYFFNMRNRTTHMNFDLSLAKKQNDESPVFYLQFAHARICSIFRMTSEEGLNISTDNLDLLVSPKEQDLVKKLYEFEKIVLKSANNYEPHLLCIYLEDLAAGLHKFYKVGRVMGSEKKIAEARLALIQAVRTVLKNGLEILGVSAPEKM
jgi:arginyl-tRNA synthetase